VLQAEVPPGKARHREGSVRTAGLHHRYRYHGDAYGLAGEGGPENVEG